MSGYTLISHVKTKLCEMCRFWLFFLWIPQDLSEIKRNHQKNQKSVENCQNYRLHFFRQGVSRHVAIFLPIFNYLGDSALFHLDLVDSEETITKIGIFT